MIAPDGRAGKGAISRSSEPRRHLTDTSRNIIKMPKFEQSPAKLEWE
jgi:hypothetical protein